MTNTTGWLGRLETLGNKLPHPTLLFVWLCLLLLPLTAVLGALELSTQHPLSEETVTARSLVDGDGIRYLFTSLVGNFTGFAPLGIVLVAMLGLGVAEQSGLLSVSLASLVRRASGRTLVITVAFAGVLSSLTVDAGYVVLIPLAGLVFQLAGRSPIAGIATAFAAVSGGFSANLLVGPVDATLAGLSTEAARIVDPTRTVDATGNYWFIIVSTFLVTALVTLVTQRITEPRLASQPRGEASAPEVPSSHPHALKWTLATLVLLLGGIALLVLPADAPLRHQDTGGVLGSPFIHGLVVTDRQRFRQMVHLGAHLRTHADAAGHFPGSHPGGLPGRRFQHQYHHPADALFRAGTGLRPPLPARHRHRHPDRPDAALQPDAVVGVVGIAGGVDRVWLAVGAITQPSCERRGTRSENLAFPTSGF